ncbi:MAG: YgaP family membrane protein [Emticicia sp.]|uniref:YgaP family membrane protein n=1 Tax=Emticicia sp. TaxID=1930953 RepID=UPI003BA74921
MKGNLGIIDKVVRILVALVIIGLYFANLINGMAAVTLLLAAGAFILTSFVSFCPLYSLLGISTQKKETK